MLETNNLVIFEGLANSSGYHTLLLDEEKGRLLVGAKDHIFSFNLLNISKDKAQVKHMIWSPCTCQFILFLTLNPFLTRPFVLNQSAGFRYLRIFISESKEKVLHVYFRWGLSHAVRHCSRHVSCTLHTWVNHVVNWNKVENRLLCDPFNSHKHTSMHTSCKSLTQNNDSKCRKMLFCLQQKLCLCSRSPGLLLPLEEMNASGQGKISW